MITYKNRGDTLSHADWDALAQEADGKLVKAYGGAPLALIFDDTNFPDMRYARRFWFYPDAGGPASVAEQYWLSIDSFGINPWKRRYRHQVFRDLVASLEPGFASPPDDVRPGADDGWPVARIGTNPLTHDQSGFQHDWDNLIWPPDGLNQGGFVSDALVFSLEAHQVQFLNQKGVLQNYYVYLDGSVAEYPHRYAPAEILIGDIGLTVDFPDYYNKYHIFRFNNLNPYEVQVNFGGHFTLTVPAMQSRCARRAAVGGPYYAGYHYFQKMLAGDPWFLRWEGTGTGSDQFGSFVAGLVAHDDNCNVTQPFVIPFLVGNMFYVRLDAADGLVNYQGKRDWTQIARVEPLYNASGYVAGKFERATPAGGHFGALAETTLMGDLAYHRGPLLVVNPAGSFRVGAKDGFVLQAQGATPAQYVLTKNDGSIALGVADVSLTRTLLADGTPASDAIAAGGGPDLNWELHGHMDGEGNTDFYYLNIFERTSGASPKLSVGDTVQVSLTHLTDDQKFFTQFDGMAGLTGRMADAGITLTRPAPGALPGSAQEKQFQLTASPERDIIGMGTNLVLGTFATPGATVGPNGLVFPCFSYEGSAKLRAIRLQADEVEVTWVKWTFDGMDYNVDPDDPVNSLTFSSRSRVAGAPLATDAGKFFGLFDPVGEVLAWLRAFGDDVQTTAEIRMTVFGPMVLWTQTAPLDFPGLGFNWQDGAFRWYYEPLAGFPGQWVRRGTFPLGSPGIFATPGGGLVNFGWPGYSAAGPGDPSAPGLDEWRTAYPRFWRVWQDWRQWRHDAAAEPFFPPFTAQSVPYWSQEHPSVKSWYETKGLPGQGNFADAQLLPVALSHTKTGMALLGKVEEIDVLTRLAAWADYEALTYQFPTGAVTANYAKGSIQQVGYYTGQIQGVPTRTRIVTNSPASDSTDGAGTARNGLPISVEHFNGAASVVNHVTGGFGGPAFVSGTCSQVLEFNAAFRPEKGFGRFGLRPREQWAMWDHGVNPETTAFVESQGITPRGAGDLPPGWMEFLNKNQSYALWDITTGALTVTELPFGRTDPRKMYDEQWGSYLFSSGFLTGISLAQMLDFFANGYRWLSVADGRDLMGALGIPFLHEELSVPCRLEIADADWQVVDGSGGPGEEFCLSRVFGLVNDPNGLWAFEPDAPGGSGPQAIRTDLGQVMGCLKRPGGKLWEANFGQETQTRLYVDAPVPATQLWVANKAYLYKRYGGRPGRAIVYGRNYADYDRGSGNDGKPGWIDSVLRYNAPGSAAEKIPRVSVEGYDEQVEVTEFLGDEVLVQTSLPNGVMEMVLEGVGL